LVSFGRWRPTKRTLDLWYTTKYILLTPIELLRTKSTTYTYWEPLSKTVFHNRWVEGTCFWVSKTCNRAIVIMGRRIVHFSVLWFANCQTLRTTGLDPFIWMQPTSIQKSDFSPSNDFRINLDWFMRLAVSATN